MKKLSSSIPQIKNRIQFYKFIKMHAAEDIKTGLSAEPINYGDMCDDILTQIANEEGIELWVTNMEEEMIIRTR